MEKLTVLKVPSGEENSMFWRGTFQLASWGDDGKGQQNNSGYPSWTATSHLMIINFIFISLETELKSSRKQRRQECYFQKCLSSSFQIITEQTYEERLFSGTPNN